MAAAYQFALAFTVTLSRTRTQNASALAMALQQLRSQIDMVVMAGGADQQMADAGEAMQGASAEQGLVEVGAVEQAKQRWLNATVSRLDRLRG